MRVRDGVLYYLLLSLVMGWTAVAFGQASLVDPSVLSQLSPEEREQLLRGFSNSQTGTSNKDQTLSNPSVITPKDNRYDDDSDPYPYVDDTAIDAEGLQLQGDDRYLYPATDEANQKGLSESRFDRNGGTELLEPDAQSRSNAQPGSSKVIKGTPSLESLRQPTRRAAAPIPAVKSFSRSSKVRPFGYELFSGTPNTFAPATDIPVPSDYFIGPGDNVRVQLFGNQNETFTLLVSRDGSINFPKLGPISTNGLRFDELQSMLEKRVSKEMIGTTASVTLGRLRSMRVFVLGDVSTPGSYTVSSLSTMTHALFISGGVSTVGSLRRVQLKRNGVVVSTLDLYRFLLGGDSSNDVRLQPGDVVFVPPVGARITVEGEVKRPAVYELTGEGSLGGALELAGGRLASSDQTYVEVERIGANAERSVLSYDIAKSVDLHASIRDGDVIRVRRIAKQIGNEIRVIGHVKYPGTYPWTESRDLRSVLEQAGARVSDSQSEIYLPLGAIERTNSQTGTREFLSFNVAATVAASGPVLKLEPNDLVMVFGREDIAYLSSYDVEAVLSGKRLSASSYERCTGLVELRGIINSQRAVRFLRTLSSESVRLKESKRSRADCPEIFQDVPRALPYLLDKSVGVYGEVMRPGVYPVADGTTLDSLVRAAAGVTSESDPGNIEYISYLDSLAKGRSRYQTLSLSDPASASVPIAAGDILNLRPVYLDQEIGSVRLLGEVRFPGTYGIVRGETMVKVLERAGGLTDNAYPYGAVFTRDNARKAEAASFKRAATDLQEAVVTVVTSGTVGTDVAATATFLEGVIRRLENAQPVGRVVVQADPAVLRVRQEQNVVMEPGDALLIPKRPSSVTVAGQVLNPGSQIFAAGGAPGDYIEQAGGYGQAADRKRSFIIFPDGSAKPLKLSSWNFEKQDVPPGSMILVPRNAAPLNKLLLSERLLSIFSNLAISAAALVTIGNN